MAKIELRYRAVVRDVDGRVKRDTGLQLSRSFVFQFLQILMGAMGNRDVAGGKDTGGAARTIDGSQLNVGYVEFVKAPDDNDTYGLVVGTGVTAEDTMDYALATKIAHGVGAGQLDYGAHSFTDPAEVGANVDMVITRTFYNGSGGTITVNEIGAYCRSVYTTDTIGYFCIIRDVLAAGVEVADTETLTVQYTIRTTV